MAVDTKDMTVRSNLTAETNAVRTGFNVSIDATVEVAAAANADSRYTGFRLPMSARIHGALSRLAWDDLASSGSPTLDIGLAPVDGNLTLDEDAINDGLALSSASTGSYFIKDIANWGKRLWEVAGLSSDPGGFADVILTIKDAAANDGGTISMTVCYSTE
jgi:hypothetical protein